MTPSDQVRDYVFNQYIEPARKRGDTTVSVRAGDVHKALHFHQRTALVCGALGLLLFQDQFRVKLQKRDGPGVGMSTTFTFEV